MNVTSLTVNITSLSLTLASNNAPASSAPTPSVETNASQDRVSLSSLLSNLQTVSGDVEQQGADKGTISLNALKHDFRQAFDTYASSGQPIQSQGHRHHHGHHHADHGAGQATALKTSDVQQALDQLTTTLQQQADSNGTVSKDALRQDARQLFTTLRGQSDT
ncbi:MAG TPA: hypothetical protein VL329_11465 [Nitrospiraceae bacterium]|nr:hypothetical protein [Nitrospiraceae bacterium]